MNIYLDMDDVVADWTGYANKFFNTPGRLAQHYLPDEEWARLKTKQRMYRDLEVKSGAYDLVQTINELRISETWCKREDLVGLYFLTALPHDDSFPYAPWDKVRWAERYFVGIPVFFGPYAKDKYKFCTPGDILIDDRKSNCDAWIQAGGKAHVYTTWENCEPWIREQLK